MNILYIDHYAGSLSMGMEFRPFNLAREWQKLGHKVRIIGADFSHLRKANPIVKNNFEIQKIDGIEFQWIKTRKYHGNGISRAITMFQFCSKLWVHAGRLVQEFKPDVVIASSTYPLDTYPAQRIKKIAKNCKLIHEIHDMWPITPIELYGMAPTHPFVVAMQISENSFCKHADKVVSVLPKASDYLQEHGMMANKFSYIPNGIELSDWNNPAPLPKVYIDVIEKAHNEGRLIFCFFGSHTRSYCLDYFIEAALKNDQKKLFLLFVGEGNYKESLIYKASSLLEPSSFAFFPAIHKSAIPSLLKRIDISYVGAMKNRMFRFGIGMNKLFDSMMGAKPLLYAVEAPNDFAKLYHCGISVEAENIDALAMGMKIFLDMSDSERATLGENGKNAVLENFTYPNLAKQFLVVMHSK